MLMVVCYNNFISLVTMSMLDFIHENTKGKKCSLSDYILRRSQGYPHEIAIYHWDIHKIKYNEWGRICTKCKQWKSRNNYTKGIWPNDKISHCRLCNSKYDAFNHHKKTMPKIDKIVVWKYSCIVDENITLTMDVQEIKDNNYTIVYTTTTPDLNSTTTCNLTKDQVENIIRGRRFEKIA